MKNKLSSLIYFLLLVIGIKSFSQNSTESYHDLIKKNYFNNSLKAKYYSHKLLDLAKARNLPKDESVAYFYLADLSGVISQKDSAFYYYDKAIQKANSIDNQELVLYHKVNKANYLFNEYDFDSAIALYTECLGLAKKMDNDYTYDYINMKIGNLNYEIGKYKEALNLFKDGLKKQQFEKNTILGAQLSISKTYLKLNEPDSAQLFAKKGLIESQKNNLKEYEIHFLNQQGLNFIYVKKYEEARKVFSEALAMSRSNEITHVERMILINLSKLYTTTNKNIEAIEILKGILSAAKNSSISIEDATQVDYLLGQNYKILGNFEMSNIYFQKYIEGEKRLGQKKIETIDQLYNINVLEIENINKKLISQKWSLTLMVIILVLIFSFYYIRKKRINQQKFDILIQKINTYESELPDEPEVFLEENDFVQFALNSTSGAKHENNENCVSREDEFMISYTAGKFTNQVINTDSSLAVEISEGESVDELDISNSSYMIKDEKVNEILEKLLKLEQKRYYLKQECTLHNVAKKLKTNTAYLSKIVNNELGKSFSTYINELRINYIIVELKNNIKLRSYSVNAIAIEIGYKRPDAFTRYFKEATGISPATYIKKINQLNK